MMKGILIGLGVILALVGFCIVILGANGLFYTPSAKEMKMGPYFYAYEDFTGPYSKTAPVFQRVYETLKKAGIENTVGIGLYHDKPGLVAPDKLRSSCGSVIAEADMAKAAALGLKTGSKSEKQSIVVEFPANSSLSYMIAPAKCYPVLTQYATDKGYTMGEPFELYDMPNKKMYVVVELIF